MKRSSAALECQCIMAFADGSNFRRPITWRCQAPAAAAKAPPSWTSATRSCRARTATACSSSCSATGESADPLTDG